MLKPRKRFVTTCSLHRELTENIYSLSVDRVVSWSTADALLREIFAIHSLFPRHNQTVMSVGVSFSYSRGEGQLFYIISSCKR